MCVRAPQIKRKCVRTWCDRPWSYLPYTCRIPDVKSIERVDSLLTCSMKLKPDFICVVSHCRKAIPLSSAIFIYTVLRGIVASFVKQNVIIEAVGCLEDIEVGDVKCYTLREWYADNPKAVRV